MLPAPIALFVPAWVFSLAAAAGTLNFQNVTSSRVVSTVAELANNEKALDAGDFDHDGDLDVVIANAYSDFGARRNKLYRNDDGVLVEVSGPPVIPGFSTADVSRAAFLRDYDGDGWLDIVVINDGLSGPSRFYLNQHPDGVFAHFEQVSGPLEGLYQDALSAVSIDVDLDGDFDLAISQGAGFQNSLLLNTGAGYFQNVTATQMPPDSDYDVDVASADLNGDGKLDLLFSDHGSTQHKADYNDLPGFDSSGPGDFGYGPGGWAASSSWATRLPTRPPWSPVTSTATAGPTSTHRTSRALPAIACSTTPATTRTERPYSSNSRPRPCRRRRSGSRASRPWPTSTAMAGPKWS